MMKYKESELQIHCVSWFRCQYPHYARLLEHPKNEGGAISHSQGAIAKAEGVQAGVADLMLHVPAYINDASIRHQECYQSLGIELKTKTGSQRPAQRIWQRLFEAAGSKYVIVRTFDDFKNEVTQYMKNVPVDVDTAVREAYEAIELEEKQKAIKQFKKLIK